MDVLLLRRIASELSGNGSAVLRFDFGGVGASGGTFTNGVEETGDVAAAFAFMADREDRVTDDLCLAGWSFGALMCLSALADGLEARSCVAVAPPLDGVDWRPLAPGLSESPARRHYVIGDRDQFCSLGTLDEFTAAVPEKEPDAVTVLDGADHFLFGREEEVAALVARLTLGTDP
jgi:alpha/beta superfamily hydrolase